MRYGQVSGSSWCILGSLYSKKRLGILDGRTRIGRVGRFAKFVIGYGRAISSTSRSYSSALANGVIMPIKDSLAIDSLSKAVRALCRRERIVFGSVEA